jgi:hypothetical protein
MRSLTRRREGVRGVAYNGRWARLGRRIHHGCAFQGHPPPYPVCRPRSRPDLAATERLTRGEGRWKGV